MQHMQKVFFLTSLPYIKKILKIQYILKSITSSKYCKSTFTSKLTYQKSETTLEYMYM